MEERENEGTREVEGGGRGPEDAAAARPAVVEEDAVDDWNCSRCDSVYAGPVCPECGLLRAQDEEGGAR